MFERLNEDARQVVAQAQEQAHSLGHDYIGTEHLLSGIAAGGSAVAEVLSEAGADLETLRRAAVEMLGSTSGSGPTLVADDDAALRAVGIDIDAVRARVEEAFGRGRRGHQSGQPVRVSEHLPSHESSFRRLISETGGAPYNAVSSLEEARRFDDAFVVLEGDDGGQIYAAFPARNVRCDEATLNTLLHDLDSIAWPGNSPGSARVFFERHPPGGGIAGGMGGGVAHAHADGWIHREFEELGLAGQIREVTAGERDRIKPPGPRP